MTPILASLLLNAAASAGSCTVDSSFTTPSSSSFTNLQDALDEPSCDSIQIQDVQLTGTFSATRDVVVTGAPGGTTIDGGACGSVFETGGSAGSPNRIWLYDLRLENGNATGSCGSCGGGLLVGGHSEVWTINLEVTDNEAEVGGGVCVYGAFHPKEALISDNLATLAGGGIALHQSPNELSAAPSLLGSDTTVRNNRSLGVGGGIAARDGSVSLDDSGIVWNQSADDGGGIYLDKSSDLLLTDSRVRRNTASDAGGGLAVDGESLADLQSTSVYGNRATGSIGGGIVVRGKSDLRLTNVTVDGNRASSFGGGLAITGESAVKIYYSTIYENTQLTSVGGEQLAAQNSKLSGIGVAIGDGSLATAADDCVISVVTRDITFSADEDFTCLSSGGGNLPNISLDLQSRSGRAYTPNVGSALIDGGDACSLASDQRGDARGAICDIGAVEAP